MLKAFEIGVERMVPGSGITVPIRIDLFTKLRQFKYISYPRICIDFVFSESSIHEYAGNDIRKTIVVDQNYFLAPDVRLNVYSAIFSMLQELWQQCLWPLEDLTTLTTTCLKGGYDVQIEGKRMPSKTRAFYAVVGAVVYPTYSDFFVEMYRKSRSIKKIHFFKGMAEPSLYLQFFSEFSWDENDHFFISGFDGQVKFVFSIDGSFILRYYPLDNNLLALQGYVKSFEPDLTDKERIALISV